MPELTFKIVGAEPASHSISPLLHLKLEIKTTPPGVPIHNVLLQCQVQIEPARREYRSSEQEQLHDLFGEPARWGQTLRPLLWTNVSLVVPGFPDQTTVIVPLPCTFDFTVATTKYFHGLSGGEIPLVVFFSGTLFHTDDNGAMQISKIGWDREAKYRLPVSIWKELMDAHYQNSAWLCLRRDIFEQLYRYKVARGIPTWDQALENILAQAEEAEAQKVR